jgi:hypothetical protein
MRLKIRKHGISKVASLDEHTKSKDAPVPWQAGFTGPEVVVQQGLGARSRRSANALHGFYKRYGRVGPEYSSSVDKKRLFSDTG